MKTKTMVYLEKDQHRALKTRARAEGISLAELIRRLAAAHLAETEPPAPISRDAYRALIGLGTSRLSDVAERHDAHLARALRKKHAR